MQTLRHEHYFLYGRDLMDLLSPCHPTLSISSLAQKNNFDSICPFISIFLFYKFEKKFTLFWTSYHTCRFRHELTKIFNTLFIFISTWESWLDLLLKIIFQNVQLPTNLSFAQMLTMNRTVQSQHSNFLYSVNCTFILLTFHPFTSYIEAKRNAQVPDTHFTLPIFFLSWF